MPDTGVAGRTVLVAGATSAAGIAVCRALADAGAVVLAVGSDADRLSAVTGQVPDAVALVCDLAREDDVAALAARVHADHGPIDGLIHLVGGWKGGGGLAGQSDEDWEFLHRRILTTLRHSTRAFDEDLRASDAGRLAIVSSVTVDSPTPGGANYATAKAAAETWVRAIAAGFAKSLTPATATVFVARALDGLESRLAAEVTMLWTGPTASDAFTRIPLDPQST